MEVLSEKTPMGRLVIDASVAIKWVIPESGTDEALSLL